MKDDDGFVCGDCTNTWRRAEAGARGVVAGACIIELRPARAECGRGVASILPFASNADAMRERAWTDSLMVVAAPTGVANGLDGAVR